jgi:serine protease Do
LAERAVGTTTESWTGVVAEVALAAVCAAALSALTTLLAVPAVPVSAAASQPGDPLARATMLASPSVVMVYYSASAMIRDSRDGSVHGRYAVQWQGSGFFVSGDGYLVTAAHVAAPSDDELKDTLVESYLGEDARAAGCEAAGNCAALEDSHRNSYRESTSLLDTNVDIRVLTRDMNAGAAARGAAPAAEVKAASPWGQRDLAVLKIDGKDEPVLPLAGSAYVQAPGPIAILGYPAGGENDASTIVPTVTSGAVSGRRQGPDAGVPAGVDLLETKAAVEQGDSGGPGIDERGEVIGMVSFKTEGATAFLMTSGDIKDLLEQAGGDNSLGPIDRLWRSGLGYMDQHRYARARDAFDRCSALNSAQTGCATMSRQATALLGRDEEWRFEVSPEPAPGLLAGVACLLALALALATGRCLALQRRYRRREAGRAREWPTLSYSARGEPITTRTGRTRSAPAADRE